MRCLAPAALSLVLATAMTFGFVACRHPPPPQLAPGGLSMSGGPSLPPIPSKSLELRPPIDLRIDLNLLDLDEFFPPGARRVGPTQPLTAELAPLKRTRFPSTELCPSPDQRYILFHDAMKRKGRNIHHWLMLLKQEKAAYPNTIFGTSFSFEASWSENSQRFAVTHFIGDNSSEVFAVGVDELVRLPIGVRPFLEEFYPPHFASQSLFLKAYRWTRDGRLVVRGLGRSREEPHELFGCEVLITFRDAGAEPQVTFLRGFIKAQNAE